MNPLPHPARGLSITLRTALWSWVVTLVTLLIFAAALLPQQKRTFQANLESKAHGVAVSLREVAAGAAVNEDYAAVVDHCKEMLHGDPDLEYLVITKNDGFSLINERTGWRAEPKAGREWRPATRTSRSGIGVVPLFNRRVFYYSQPFDYSGIQWGWIHVGLSLRSYDRDVASISRRAALLAIGCIVLSLAASGFYAAYLVKPILDLRNVVQRVAGGDLTARAEITRNDELGTLASSVNVMTEALLRRDRFLEERVKERTQELVEEVRAKDRAHAQLAEAQHQLMEASREAGMAEVATSVLHNVGNVLNSVNVSVQLVSERLGRSPAPTLAKVAALLQQHQADFAAYLSADPKGRLVPELLVRLAAALDEERTQVLAEMQGLLRNVEHIKEIVAMQQSYGRVAGVIEDLPVTSLIEDALRMNEGALLRGGIAVQREFQEVPPVRVDKHQVLQILINLLCNAKYALQESRRADPQLTLGVSCTAQGRVQVTVRDNGIGIEPANLTRIFAYGFTTKKDGHGFGLHSGALAAQTMGGALRAFSEGPGRGATFTLELPLAGPAATASATAP